MLISVLLPPARYFNHALHASPAAALADYVDARFPGALRITVSRRYAYSLRQGGANAAEQRAHGIYADRSRWVPLRGVRARVELPPARRARRALRGCKRDKIREPRVRVPRTRRGCTRKGPIRSSPTTP